MNRIVLSSLFVLFMLMTSLASAEKDPLASFRWDYRLILVSAPAGEADEIVAALKAAQAGIDERQVLWFVFDGPSVTTNHEPALDEDFRTKVLKRYFKDIKAGSSAVRLIGKDGGVKERANKLDLTRLFALIDAMPMRQAEMKGKNST